MEFCAHDEVHVHESAHGGGDGYVDFVVSIHAVGVDAHGFEYADDAEGDGADADLFAHGVDAVEEVFDDGGSDEGDAGGLFYVCLGVEGAVGDASVPDVFGVG